MKRIVPLAFGLALSTGSAFAQDHQTTLPVQNINFDMWCQETQHLPPDRCDKRLPEDEKAFEDYRDKIEPYEVEYLKNRQNQEDVSSGILHNDPVDKPVKPSAPTTDAPGNVPPH